ncbi:TrkA-N domain-containing protein [Salinarchaeum sp. Harcht-Bsk1]|uniref:NAD-binding protein n=1 Tax=Salinarchaeum sp. Harcht-Bsk1 TaxID=1333523 RepID=UPI0003423B10|nr:NAD-binding protein [Salinarchaeum sp. Harcht-Bsk1]AGN02734.1 TrkA-N domain-containing protein [Salinarchaeum sp. Harcht-Bsk1]
MSEQESSKSVFESSDDSEPIDSATGEARTDEPGPAGSLDDSEVDDPPSDSLDENAAADPFDETVAADPPADPLDDTVVGDPLDETVEPGSHVVVVGYDGWTPAVLTELEVLDVSVSVITRRESASEGLAERPVSVVPTDDVNEACFREAGIDRADAVLVATLDDQLNVLAVLTVMNVDESMHVVTFAGEEEDVPKLRAAGADRVVSLGQAVGELLVEVALSERQVDDVVAQLLGENA